MLKVKKSRELMQALLDHGYEHEFYGDGKDCWSNPNENDAGMVKGMWEHCGKSSDNVWIWDDWMLEEVPDPVPEPKIGELCLFWGNTDKPVLSKFGVYAFDYYMGRDANNIISHLSLSYGRWSNCRVATEKDMVQ